MCVGEVARASYLTFVFVNCTCILFGNYYQSCDVCLIITSVNYVTLISFIMNVSSSDNYTYVHKTILTN